MENTLASEVTRITMEAFVEAAKLSNEHVPPIIHDAIAAITASDDPKKVNDILQDLEQNLGIEHRYIQHANLDACTPSTDDQQRWASLICWITESLISWSPAIPNAEATLEVLLIAGFLVDATGTGWINVRDRLQSNEALLTTLERRLGKARLDVPSHARDGASDLIANLNSAYTERDWPTLEDLLHPVQHMPATGAFAQTVRWLALLDPPRLYRAIDAMSNILFSDAVVDVLGKDSALAAAAHTSDLGFKFSAILRTFHTCGLREPPKETSVKGAEDILLQVSAHLPDWNGWMHVFCEHPIRYPLFNIALGRVLPKLNSQHWHAYLYSISLSRHSNQGGPAAVTLRLFRDNADIAARTEMWALAYQRWSDWNYGIADVDSYLIEISPCMLDFAVVGYFAETINRNDLETYIAQLDAELAGIELSWAKSYVELAAKRNRLRSKLWLARHAQIVRGGAQDWLPGEPGRDSNPDPYLKAKYR
jgi:hypothetical protein